HHLGPTAGWQLHPLSSRSAPSFGNWPVVPQLSMHPLSRNANLLKDLPEALRAGGFCLVADAHLWRRKDAAVTCARFLQKVWRAAAGGLGLQEIVSRGGHQCAGLVGRQRPATG